ncbi:uncharacterized protein F4822DRAFT_408549 [Hypoxylon trugodes]|uniref:uncharacterized protein n=1 Tax=Hypoxylon trugodes TaxID=326681 RepID=UPI00219FE90D|nr:uncharacterized protein F4822DRAFT_408549 [Hypoxylon trugodes]KAI1388084.1 hypothetical protein F4822DRAFT_408549 [Hypoxylon trugodes]
MALPAKTKDIAIIRKAPPRNYVRIAMAPRPDTDTDTREGILNGEWNQDPSWLWPASLYQPYCLFHFLKECSLYHIYQSEWFKLTTRTTKNPRIFDRPRMYGRGRVPKKYSRSNVKRPTRSRDSSPCSDTSDNSSPHFNQLQLSLPWPVHKTRLENLINGIYFKLLDERTANEENIYESSLVCRYCRFNANAEDTDESGTRKVTPPAPMHHIRPEDIKKEHVGKFGGITFAIDPSGDDIVVILLGMEQLDHPVREVPIGPRRESFRVVDRLGRRNEQYLNK